MPISLSCFDVSFCLLMRWSRSFAFSAFVSLPCLHRRDNFSIYHSIACVLGIWALECMTWGAEVEALIRVSGGDCCFMCRFLCCVAMRCMILFSLRVGCVEMRRWLCNSLASLFNQCLSRCDMCSGPFLGSKDIAIQADQSCRQGSRILSLT